MSGEKQSRWREFLDCGDFPLLRLLVFSPGFRLTFALVMVFLVGVPVMLLKVWPVETGQAGFEMRISLLDRLQAWSLLRSAKKARAAGEVAEAVHAWRSGIANDPGNDEACRGFLDFLREADSQRRYFRDARQNAMWMLRSGRPNVVDVTAVVQVFDFYGADSLTLAVLKDYPVSMTPTLERARLKALFREGQMEEFAREWEEGAVRREDDDEVALLGLAYQAGWGPAPAAGEALTRFRGFLVDGPKAGIAHRFHLRVSRQLLDAEKYAESLEYLRRRQQDGALDHVRFWEMLIGLGRESEAMRLASHYALPPQSAREAVAFADVYARLGLQDLAFRYLQRHTEDFGAHEGLWQSQAALLVEGERWSDLFTLAVRIRLTPGVTELGQALSHYFEGLAEFGRQRQGSAREAFARVSRYSLTGSGLGLHMAAKIYDAGFVEECRNLLLVIQETFSEKLVFWELLFQTALELESARDLLLATENMYRLQPNSVEAQCNFAASLVSSRVRPQEAIALTYSAMNGHPDRVPCIVNHAHALLLNGRVNEAEELLERINPKPLPLTLKQGFYLAKLEIAFSRSRLPEAFELIELIEPSLLMPGDRDRLQVIRNHMGMR